MDLGTLWDLRPGHAPASHQPLGWNKAMKDQGQPRSGGVARGVDLLLYPQTGMIQIFSAARAHRGYVAPLSGEWGNVLVVKTLCFPWPKAVAKDSAV